MRGGVRDGVARRARDGAFGVVDGDDASGGDSSARGRRRHRRRGAALDVEAFGLWYVLFPALAGSLFIVCMSETCQLMKKRFEFELSDVASAFARS